jgi:hypothetical protein
VKSLAAIFLAACLAHGCQLFAPRDAEEPNSTSGQFLPPSEAANVVANLQKAVELKSVAGYAGCFSDGSTGLPAFSFIPSSEGSAQYGPLFQNWSTNEERAYFQNLSAQVTATSASSLTLIQKSILGAADSSIVEYDYVLVFEHTDGSFPKSASGHMQLALLRNSNNVWAITRWSDFKTTPTATTWSLFKGKFSN